MNPSEQDVRDAVEALARCEAPFVIGVRHHSPACAAAVPTLLDRFRPDELFVELPAELEAWLPWLGHAETLAPVALAVAERDGARLGFYPFADFSPELAAVRWAIAREVPVRAFDRPFGEREEVGEDCVSPEDASFDPPSDSPLAALQRSLGTRSVEDTWERLVEAYAPSQDAEAIRRAALAFGWFLREDAEYRRSHRPSDLAREAYMRDRLASAKGRAVAVVGAFHAPAIVGNLGKERVEYRPVPRRETTAALVPYAFDLLDSRSGYPSGIRDPSFQDRVHAVRIGRESVEESCRELVVAVARAVRSERHVAGVPDATEAVRMALDLARLRGLPAPGRRELLEAIESCFARGEVLGRGRALARALDAVLVGRRRGRLARGTPRSGLVPHVHELLQALGLPHALDERPRKRSERVEPWVLDPMRSPLDERRHIALERLSAAGVSYAVRDDRPLGDAELLTARWKIEWTPTTDAMLELAGIRGVTLEQAAEGSLRAAERRVVDAGGPSAAERLVLLEDAARAALPELTRERAYALVAPAGAGPAGFVETAGLAEVSTAVALLDRLVRGHFPGLPAARVASRGLVPPGARTTLLALAVRAIEGLTGSERVQDARALGDVVLLRDASDEGVGRLGAALDALVATGSPLMQGAGGAARVLVGREAPAALGERLGSWVDAGAEGLGDRVRGVLLLATSILEAEPELLTPLVRRVDALDDRAFLARLPALRDGFEALSPAARTRLLAVVAELTGEDPLLQRGLVDAPLAAAPVLLGKLAEIDLLGFEALVRRGLASDASVSPERTDENALAPLANRPVPREAHALTLLDRFRLLLGREQERLSANARAASIALDELYGRGRGEGSRGDLTGGGAGTEPAFPSVRAWAGELSALFGERAREDVLGRAVDRGVGAAMLALDPDSVRPSVQLLESVLSLKGGLAEADLAHLRKLVARVVTELTRELSSRVQPALAGLARPRPAYRPTGLLDLRRTVARNLRSVRKRPGQSSATLLPERLVWKSRSKRSLDWHVVLVVDVSGSMEASVVHSALMAAILNALPALSVRFLAFSTQVVDLSDRVDDPLGLLLEISVGGGTLIAQALRYARGLLKVPQRSIVIVVSDFEEGGSVAELVGETRALAETGCKALGLAALDDRGAPRYHRGIAELVVGAGMPIAALTPLELAHWIAEKIR